MLRRNAPCLGVSGLSKYIMDNAPSAIKPRPIDFYRGKKVAVDTSFTLLAFANSMARQGSASNPSVDPNYFFKPSEETGEYYSAHLTGTLHRCMWYRDAGITPVWVFDGKRPELKKDTSAWRVEQRKIAAQKLEDLRAAGGEIDEIEEGKLAVAANQLPVEAFDEVRALLRVLGVPYLDAPYEAEAQCAELANGGLVYGVSTGDMDTLAFGAPVLIRGLDFSGAKKQEIREFHLFDTLQGLQMRTRSNFVDLCIMMGCDYCDKMNGYGPKTIKAISKHFNSIDHFLASKAHAQLDMEYRLRQLEPEASARALVQVKQLMPFWEDERGRMTKQEKLANARQSAAKRADAKRLAYQQQYQAMYPQYNSGVALQTQQQASEPARNNKRGKRETWVPSAVLKEQFGPEELLKIIQAVPELSETEAMVPDCYPHAAARQMFMQHPVLDCAQLATHSMEYQEPNYEHLAILLASKGIPQEGIESRISRFKSTHARAEAKEAKLAAAAATAE